MEIGSGESDTALDNVLKTVSINECCTLVYTVSNLSFDLPGRQSHYNYFSLSD